MTTAIVLASCACGQVYYCPQGILPFEMPCYHCDAVLEDFRTVDLETLYAETLSTDTYGEAA